MATYETIAIDQAGPGTTVIRAAVPFKRIDVINYVVVLAAAGTFAFSDGTDWLSGDMPMAANGELLQMRWVDATKVCVIQEITILEFRDITTAFVAGPYNFKVFRSTAWSADGSGGGAVAVTDPAFQVRSAMGTSLFSTGFRLATTAALGAGTKTLDTNPMGACFGNVGSTPAIAQLYIPAGSPVTGYGGPGVELLHPDIGAGEHPVTLVQNEGISICATVPATGTWIASMLVKWAELTAF